MTYSWNLWKFLYFQFFLKMGMYCEIKKSAYKCHNVKLWKILFFFIIMFYILLNYREKNYKDIYFKQILIPLFD